MFTNEQIESLKEYLRSVKEDYLTRVQLDNDQDTTDEVNVETELRQLVKTFGEEPGPEGGLGGLDPLNKEQCPLVTLRLTAFLFNNRLMTILTREKAKNDTEMWTTSIDKLNGEQLIEIIVEAMSRAKHRGIL